MLRGMTNAPASPSLTPPPDAPSEPLLTVQEVADACEAHERWVLTWVFHGKLLALSTLEGLRFERSHLVTFLRSQGHAEWSEEVRAGKRPVCRIRRAS
jgi:hypothetical protein